MRGKKAKELRRQAVGDPDMEGRVFAVGANFTTYHLHPQSYRKQYQQAKGLVKGRKG